MIAKVIRADKVYEGAKLLSDDGTLKTVAYTLFDDMYATSGFWFPESLPDGWFDPDSRMGTYDLSTPDVECRKDDLIVVFG